MICVSLVMTRPLRWADRKDLIAYVNLDDESEYGHLEVSVDGNNSGKADESNNLI
jgi:hypothetical protein